MSFQFDKTGNRTLLDATNYVSNNLNQYTHVGSTSFSNDSNGNLTNDGNHTYTYDVENRLTSSLYPLTSSYQYDGFGRRISKTVSGITTYFIYDGDQIVEERDSNGTLKASYVYGNGIDEVLTRSTTDDGRPTHYYFMDGLGSVTDLANTNGELVESYTYDAYGTPNAPSAVGNPFMFTGREYDSESGLYHYRARAYSPTIGRFLQRDPIGYFDSMNLFSYVNNNPLNWIDPLGLTCKKETDEENGSEQYNPFKSAWSAWDKFWKFNSQEWKDTAKKWMEEGFWKDAFTAYGFSGTGPFNAWFRYNPKDGFRWGSNKFYRDKLIKNPIWKKVNEWLRDFKLPWRGKPGHFR